MALNTPGVVSLASRNMLYSQVLTHEQAISFLLKSSSNNDIKEVLPVPHSPCNPTVMGVSLRVIKFDNAKLYFSTFNKSSDLSEMGLSVIELIGDIYFYIFIKMFS